MKGVFSVDVCHLFPQCLLAVIPLIGGVTGVGPGTALNVAWGLPFALWVILPCQRPVCFLAVAVGAPRSTSELCFLAVVGSRWGLKCSHWERSHRVVLCWSCPPVSVLCCVTCHGFVGSQSTLLLAPCSAPLQP